MPSSCWKQYEKRPIIRQSFGTAWAYSEGALAESFIPKPLWCTDVDRMQSSDPPAGLPRGVVSQE